MFSARLLPSDPLLLLVHSPELKGKPDDRTVRMGGW